MPAGSQLETSLANDAQIIPLIHEILNAIEALAVSIRDNCKHLSYHQKWSDVNGCHKSMNAIRNRCPPLHLHLHPCRPPLLFLEAVAVPPFPLPRCLQHLRAESQCGVMDQ